MRLAAIALAIGLPASVAAADPYVFTVQNGGGSFTYSGVHSAGSGGTHAYTRDPFGVAQGATPDPTFKWSGSKLLGFPLGGQIIGDLTGNVFTVTTPTVLTGAQGNLTIKSGKLTHASGVTYGTLDYHIDFIPDSATYIDHDWTFYFYGTSFVGGANVSDFTDSSTVPPNVITLWGNNWRNHLESAPAGAVNIAGVKTPIPQLGVDLKLTGQPVPEPASILLIAAGAGFAVVLRRRRKTS